MKAVPEGGMCISAFLVLSKKGDAASVLMGGSTRTQIGNT
jgi:hypothetical protein